MHDNSEARSRCLLMAPVQSSHTGRLAPVGQNEEQLRQRQYNIDERHEALPSSSLDNHPIDRTAEEGLTTVTPIDVANYPRYGCDNHALYQEEVGRRAASADD